MKLETPFGKNIERKSLNWDLTAWKGKSVGKIFCLTASAVFEMPLIDLRNSSLQTVLGYIGVVPGVLLNWERSL